MPKPTSLIGSPYRSLTSIPPPPPSAPFRTQQSSAQPSSRRRKTLLAAIRTLGGSTLGQISSTPSRSVPEGEAPTHTNTA